MNTHENSQNYLVLCKALIKAFINKDYKVIDTIAERLSSLSGRELLSFLYDLEVMTCKTIKNINYENHNRYKCC